VNKAEEGNKKKGKKKKKKVKKEKEGKNDDYEEEDETTEASEIKNSIGQQCGDELASGADATSAQATESTVSDTSSPNPKPNPSTVPATVHPSELWIPSEEWLDGEFRNAVSLQTISQLLENLLPQVAALGPAAQNEANVLAMIQQGTMVGLLRVPHAITMRRYEPTSQFTKWVSVLVWGSVYATSNRSTPPIFEGIKIELFPVLSEYYG